MGAVRAVSAPHVGAIEAQRWMTSHTGNWGTAESRAPVF